MKKKAYILSRLKAEDWNAFMSHVLLKNLPDVVNPEFFPIYPTSFNP